MTEVYNQEERKTLQHHHHQPTNESRSSYKVAKAATSAAAGSSLVILSGLTFTGTVLELVVVTPLLVLFSPVLVPASITLFLLVTGFVTSILFGVTGTIVLAWLYKYVTTNEHPTQASSDHATKFGLKGDHTMTRGEHATEGGTNEVTQATSDRVKFGSKGDRTMPRGEHATDGGNNEATQATSDYATKFGSKGDYMMTRGEHATGGGQSEVLTTVANFLMSTILGGPLAMVLTWFYKYVTGEYPRGSDKLDRTMHKMGSKAREMKDKGEHMTEVITRKEVVDKATRTMIGVSLLGLSGLTFVGTVVGLVSVTPLFVIFSPVLVSAVAAVLVLVTGFMVSGGLAIAGVTVLVWLYKYVNDQRPIGADSLDRMVNKLGLMGREMGERSEHASKEVRFTGGVGWGRDES